ncbi:hypothetical protein [Mycobacteroides salmoniphilum]|nr:hypothetical protein [Mycobacteroides salmoniphilum]
MTAGEALVAVPGSVRAVVVAVIASPETVLPPQPATVSAAAVKSVVW